MNSKINVMKSKLILSFCFWGLITISHAQSTAAGASDASASSSVTATYNLLQPPDNPSLTFLGTQISSVDRPETPADFQVSLENGISNFGNGQDYAVQLAPYWIFDGSNISYQGFASNADVGQNILQTLSISVAEGIDPTDKVTPVIAEGIQFSIFQGEIVNNDDVEKILSKLTSEEAGVLNNAANAASVSLANNGVTTGDALAQGVSIAQAQALTDFWNSNQTELNTALSKFSFKRIGWKLGLTGGLSEGFANGNIGNGSVDNYGAWLTAGYDGEGPLSAFVVAKYLADNKNTSNSAADFGAKLIGDFKPFSISLETVNQSPSNNVLSDSKWRYDLEVDYLTSDNKTISLDFGSDQSNPSGNLIALVSAVMGFGTNRPLGVN